MKIYELLNKRTLQIKEKNINFISMEMKLSKVEAEKIYVEWKKYYLHTPVNENFHTEKRVRNMETGEVFIGLKCACEKTGMKRSNISNACNTGLKAGGYHWEYI